MVEIKIVKDIKYLMQCLKCKRVFVIPEGADIAVVKCIHCDGKSEWVEDIVTDVDVY